MNRTNTLIRLSKSCIGDNEKNAVLEVLNKGYLGMGSEVQTFEKMLSDFFERPATCVVNGTAALQLAIQGCNIGAGDEVLVPSLTYVASFQAISACGAKPIACDITTETLTLDWRSAEKRLTEKTRAIMPVHYTGGMRDLKNIYALAKANNLRVIEDAAHAFGTVYDGKRVGNTGDICCFSFDGIKNITSGEGGCIVTDDETVLQNIRDARLLGVQKDTENRYLGLRSWEFDVVNQGWRYHMSNLMAAIGIEQLKRFDELAGKRKLLAKEYDLLLAPHSHIVTLKNDYSVVVPHIYVVRILGLKDRKDLQQRMLNWNIQTGIHYQPNHWLSFYRDPVVETFEVTDKVFPELLTLPLHPDLEISDIKYVVDVLINEIKLTTANI